MTWLYQLAAGGHRVSLNHPGVTAAKATSLAAVLAANVTAWFGTLTPGGIVSAVSVIGVGVAGVGGLIYTQWRTVIDRADAARRRQEMELEAEEYRLRLKLKAEQEQADRDSLSAQVAKVQESLDEARKRVEDANAKLHDQRNEWNAALTRHKNDADDLRDQLAETYKEVHELRQQNRDLLKEVQTVRDENRQLLRKLDQVAGRVEDNTRKVADCGDAIQGLQAKADGEKP